LGEGRIEEGILICPGHEWRFELKSGWCPQNPELSTEVYPIKVHDGKIYVRLEKPKVEGVAGSAANSLPSDIKFKIPTILKPRNPDEEL
jgi:phenylpropionate dioxygenase-like ring-hydroxylating dioxygenase large terminal subunit